MIRSCDLTFHIEGITKGLNMDKQGEKAKIYHSFRHQNQCNIEKTSLKLF